MFKIAIQGKSGSFSHLCVKNVFPEFELVECKWFDDLFSALDSGKADRAVCPVENSIAGTIIQTYDLIFAHPEIQIIGEYYLRVEHNLIGVPGAKLSDIKRVYSHPMAIRQCGKFLEQHDFEVIESDDTAGSVANVINENDPTHAAIASSLASEIYGGDLLARNIEDDSDNYTRFWVLAKSKEVIPQNNKLSIVFETSHAPGSLAKVLNILASADINLTKLESRPVVGKVWKYYFYCDLNSSLGVQHILNTLDIIKPGVEMLRILGNYQQADLNLATA